MVVLVGNVAIAVVVEDHQVLLVPLVVDVRVRCALVDDIVLRRERGRAGRDSVVRRFFVGKRNPIRLSEDRW